MSIQREFVLRYRSRGHVRFQVPERICNSTISEFLEQRLVNIEGVLSAKLYSKQGKLSIRFEETVCTINGLLKQLSELLNTLEQSIGFESKTSVAEKSWRKRFSDKVSSLKAGRWLQGKYSDAKETVQAAKVITKLGMKKPRAFLKNPEQTIIDFLNDILVLYLIKIHWGRITKEWIPNPLKYRYEWLAVWYLFFLLMRSKRTRA